MQALKAILLSALVGLTLATNTTIRYFSTKEGCIGGYFQCSNVATGYRCHSYAPWCTYVDCPDCIANGLSAYSLPTHASDDCSGDAIQPVCASTSKNNICCSINHAKEPDICSTMVATDDRKKHVEGEGCLGVVQPDTLVYTDKEGAQHNVHIPNGSFEQAVELATTQDWDMLAKLFVSSTS